MEQFYDVEFMRQAAEVTDHWTKYPPRRTSTFPEETFEVDWIGRGEEREVKRD